MTTILTYQPRHYEGVDALWRTVFPNDPPYNRAAQAVPAKLALGRRPVHRRGGGGARRRDGDGRL